MSEQRVICTSSEERPYLENGFQHMGNKSVWSVPVDSLVLEFIETPTEYLAKYIVVAGGACEYLLDAVGKRIRITDLDAHSYEEFILKATIRGLAI